ncbi:Sir2 family NAD-dependent protein deacetylase [Nocardioides sp. InS609-2]|uniref:Sir2 family NAD-dependent protein deacetylase n=1 Tax=Nocardioides sp. InS609-2 TaxID=2760705 RepID=UPI0020C178B0|nr:Sir2 family NAD-dependent protein deacetylase [Nocardioides sp. InS609-2]
MITQNVDDLHERGGSKNVLHMHGELRSALCLACGYRFTWAGNLSHCPACPGCAAAMLRPDIVWFGEIPYRMDEGAPSAAGGRSLRHHRYLFCGLPGSGVRALGRRAGRPYARARAAR